MTGTRGARSCAWRAAHSAARWLTLDLSKVAQRLTTRTQAQESAGTPTTSFLSQAELADVDAIAAQIIPTDATPGAREAGVALFIDRALATFFGRMAPDFRSQLAAFRLHCQARYPDCRLVRGALAASSRSSS